MRRVALGMLTTITVLVLLFGYHTSTQGRVGIAATTFAASTPAAGRSDAAAESSDGSSTSGADEQSSTGQAPSASASPTPSTKSGATTVTGDVAQTRWGPVQVAITVEDGAITEVSVPQYPSNNPKDVQINNYALPVLVNETLQAQSANIDMISGATVTSVGYQQSLQSAIDQAGL